MGIHRRRTREGEEMNESEITDKLKPIAQKAKVIDLVCKEIVEDLEKQAIVILGLNKEQLSESKIKIAIKNAQVEIRLEKTSETHYYYPLIDGYTSPYDGGNICQKKKQK